MILTLLLIIEKARNIIKIQNRFRLKESEHFVFKAQNNIVFVSTSFRFYIKKKHFKFLEVIPFNYFIVYELHVPLFFNGEKLKMSDNETFSLL